MTNPRFAFALEAKRRKAEREAIEEQKKDDWQGMGNNRIRNYLDSRKKLVDKELYNAFFFAGVVL